MQRQWWVETVHGTNSIVKQFMGKYAASNGAVNANGREILIKTEANNQLVIVPGPKDKQDSFAHRVCEQLMYEFRRQKLALWHGEISKESDQLVCIQPPPPPMMNIIHKILFFFTKKKPAHVEAREWARTFVEQLNVFRHHQIKHHKKGNR